MSEKKKFLGKGLDIGTMNIVAAEKVGNSVRHRKVRDCFLDLEKKAKKMLKIRRVDFVEREDEDEILVIGDPAMDIANVFNREVRRPLSSGLISSSEIDSVEVLGVMIKSVLRAPTEPGEYCCFSIPADPIDQPDKDVVYHKRVFSQIVKECGYTPIPSNEAMAIIYSETEDTGFSGIACSFGAGMVNVALSVNALEVFSFSVARSGDWIDAGAAKSLNLTASNICAIKEDGFDLRNPETREQKAITHYYREMIQYVIDQFVKQFKLKGKSINLREEIPIVVAGGTSKAGGFMDLFQEEFDARKKRFPLKVSEVRQAKDPLNAIASGMLVQAMMEHDE